MPDTLKELTKAVLEGEDELAGELTQNALGEKLNPLSISEAVMAGIQKAGRLWKENIYFQPDIIMSAEAFRVAMEAIEPHLSEGGVETAGRVLIVPGMPDAEFDWRKQFQIQLGGFWAKAGLCHDQPDDQQA